MSNWIINDLCDAWRLGGRRTYCYLDSVRCWAQVTRDHPSGAELDWLTDILDLKTESEILEVI